MIGFIIIQIFPKLQTLSPENKTPLFCDSIYHVSSSSHKQNEFSLHFIFLIPASTTFSNTCIEGQEAESVLSIALDDSDSIKNITQLAKVKYNYITAILKQIAIKEERAKLEKTVAAKGGKKNALPKKKK